jgi:DNA-binding transcriptional regulator YiaG
LTLSAIAKRMKIFTMTMIRLSGSQLHAARVLVGLSRESLAERAGLCRHSIRKWETSSHAIPGAMYSHLVRVVDVLESQGRALQRRWATCSAPPLHRLSDRFGIAEVVLLSLQIPAHVFRRHQPSIVLQASAACD